MPDAVIGDHSKLLTPVHAGRRAAAGPETVPDLPKRSRSNQTSWYLPACFKRFWPRLRDYGTEGHRFESSRARWETPADRGVFGFVAPSRWDRRWSKNVPRKVPAPVRRGWLGSGHVLGVERRHGPCGTRSAGANATRRAGREAAPAALAPPRRRRALPRWRGEVARRAARALAAAPGEREIVPRGPGCARRSTPGFGSHITSSERCRPWVAGIRAQVAGRPVPRPEPELPPARVASSQSSARRPPPPVPSGAARATAPDRKAAHRGGAGA
jgi:hypothetical protein